MTDALQRHVDAGDIAREVAGVMRHGRLVYFEAVGQRDIAAGSAMPADAIFRLYSMTRPITSLAALMLYEEGKLGLDAPVSRYLPALANRRVFDDPDDPVMTRTHPATREMTVTDLIRFTSGLGGRNSRIYRDHDVRSREISIQQFIENVAGMPLFEEPRSRW